MLKVPLDEGKTLTGTLDQFRRLAVYLHQQVAQAPNPRRRAQVHLWDDQMIIGSYADLEVLAARLSALAAPPARTRYPAPTTPRPYAAGAISFSLPGRSEPVTQTLNARGTTGGLRLPDPQDAQPADPAARHLSRVRQPYVAQICQADLQSPWHWTPRDPIYTAQAGHILVAAVLIAIQHHLLLTDEQMLAIRWQRSHTWDCYLPAPLLNSWSLLVAHHLEAAQQPMEHPTTNLNPIAGR
jgi:hypothetical protein